MSRRRRATPEIPRGTRIAGRYEIESKLGEGGMAEVYRALDVDTGRRVAVKILLSEIVNNSEAVERTKREGKLLSELNNPAIVQVESYGQLDNGAVFLVMELLEGETLGTRMRRGALEPLELAPIVAGTCAGLSAAHARNVVHRDLKPDNIFLCPTVHGLQVKLLDFGISKVYSGERLTKTGEVLGTPRYMSPEQLGAEHDVDGRADVYALGVILYEALAHKAPFLAASPTDLIIAILNGKVAPLRTVRPDVSSNVEGVVMRAMSKLREARFDTAKELAEAYIEAAGGVASVRRQQRRGLATRALGGKVATAVAVPTTSPPPPRSEGRVAGALKLGTFSGLREMSAAAAPSSALTRPSSKAARTMGAAAGAAGIGAERPAKASCPGEDALSSPAPARPRMPPTRAAEFLIPDTPVPDHPPPSVPSADRRPEPTRSARSVPPTAMMDSYVPGAIPVSIPVSEPTATPRRMSRWVRVGLVVGALLAGALSAAAVVLFLTWYEHHNVDEPSGEPPERGAAETPEGPVEISAEAPETGSAMAGQRSERGTEVPAPGAAEPSGVDPPEAAPTRRRRGSAPGAPGRRRSGRGTSSRSSSATRATEPARPPRDPNSPRELLRAARQALRAGDGQRCVSLLDQAIQNGAPAIALRRRGECYDHLGQRAEAISDYQRFCRIAHDHPAIAEVRPLLESWGQRCD